MASTELTMMSAFDAASRQASSPVRLRLVSCRLERAAGATSRVTAEFAEPATGEPLICRQEGVTCVGGDLRLAALATLDALTHCIDGALRFELIGVKPMRAFDTNLMVVALLAHQNGTVTRVVGTAIAENDQLDGVARATLHAVNRLVAPHMMRLDPFA